MVAGTWSNAPARPTPRAPLPSRTQVEAESDAAPLPVRAPRPAPPRRSRDRRHDVVALLVRTALLLVVALGALGRGEVGSVLPWLVALAALTAGGHWLRPPSQPTLWCALESATCCIGVAFTGGATSPLLAYLPAAAFAAGLAAGARSVVLVAGLDSALLLAVRAHGGQSLGSWAEYAASSEHGVLLALVLGLLGAWSRHRSAPVEGPDPRYVEAHLLLERLRAVTRRLPGSLDPASSAEHLLDRCFAAAGGATRGAVLLVTDDPPRLVPLAVRGTRRVPWRSPLDGPGPLRTAHLGRHAVLNRRPPDRDGRRQGSALLVLPMTVGDRSIGLVILESRELAAFDDLVDALEQRVAEDALHIDSGMLFEEVRTWASLQERERLAQDMHDGVAQDLASVGFELDALRHVVQRQAPALSEDVVRLRTQITHMVSDLRLSITDLRSGLGQERGLGAALTSYARGVATARGLAVHLSLDESAFRLPGEFEVLLFKVAQEAIGAARRDRTVENLWVSLTVDPPSGLLRVEHDGCFDPDEPGRGLDLKLVREHVDRLGGELVLTPGHRGGLRLDVVLEGNCP